MKPEDIRRLYAQEGAATDAEARATMEEIRTDPDAARKHILVMEAMAQSGDRDFGLLFSAFLVEVLAEIIKERSAHDDAFARRCGEIAVALMEKMATPTPRGRPGKAKPTKMA